MPELGFDRWGQDSLSPRLYLMPTPISNCAYCTSIVSIVGQLSMILKCGFVNVALLT